MSKIAFFILILSLIALNFACSTTETTNSNNSANVKTIDEANLPEGFSNKPLTPSGNSTPGIPDQSNINIKPNPNGTPTPGIPAPGNVNVKPNPKGTPTPGIPANINSATSVTDSDKTPQPKTNRKP